MDLKEMTKIIREYFPEKAIDLSESLELLRDALEETRRDAKKMWDLLFEQGRDNEMSPYIKLSSTILEYISKIQELEAELEPEDYLVRGQNDEEENELPDYGAYIVDSEIVHTLMENFTYTRPAAFELHGTHVEARTWIEVLIKTCEYLLNLDRDRFLAFENDPAMRGRKQKQFSSNHTDLRKPIKIDNSNLYVESNLNANAIRNVISKMLTGYEIKKSEYKVFLRADYTELHS